MMHLDTHVHSIRILYMPPIYSIISFFSYRFFRSYTYYALVQVGTLPLFFCPGLTLIPYTVYEVCRSWFIFFGEIRRLRFT